MATDINVFICYAREDIDIAKRLYADLERAGVEYSSYVRCVRSIK